MKNLAKILIVAPLLLTTSVNASQYETDENTEIVYDLPASEQQKLSQDLDPEPTVLEESRVSSDNLRKSHNYLQRITVLKGTDSKKTKKAKKSYDVQKSLNKTLGTENKHWSTEIFETPNEAPVYLNDFLARLQNWVMGEPMTEDDQSLNFVTTKNNKLELYTTYDIYHAKLFSDIDNAKETIHMQMYGWHADGYGLDMSNRLIKKAKEGVKVRVLMDKFGAHITGIFVLEGKPMLEVIQSMRDAGVEVITPEHHGLNRLDHRKLYVFDGKIAWNTGYTISDLMRNDVMDQGTRIQGDLTYQYQSYFLVNWLYAGGTFPEAKTSMDDFWKKYFKPLDETGTAEVKLLTNISRVKMEVSEDYLTKIANAKKQVIVVNRNFADPRFGKALIQAKKNGADVTVVLEEGTGSLYTYYAERWLAKFQKQGINAYYFRDKDGKKLIHSKIVLTDEWVSLGTANFDLWSMYHNGEQNMITKDPLFVEAVRNHMQTEVIQYSNVFQAQKGFFNKLKLSLKGILFKTYEIIF